MSDERSTVKCYYCNKLIKAKATPARKWLDRFGMWSGQHYPLGLSHIKCNNQYKKQKANQSK